ncbi:MAG: orotate phosphoribosyltransferase [Bacteroidales bacterium]|jgi:orotate phosphoribosyltransferase|nr:orotate phosphoribosyltransferase [Bacteroidales bacterium]
MNIIEKKIAEYLLQINAIKLQPANPFTWASGWKSPIYCDNRKTLSYPAIRKVLAQSFAQKVKEMYPHTQVIAGVATGAIAIGVLAAEELNLPFIYVRSSSKAHGLTNTIEGYFEKGQNVVVIEDLISTGGSSLKAVEALRDAGCNVLGMLAIFTYEFEIAMQNFKKYACELTTLSNYSVLLTLAEEKKYITPHQIQSLQEWRKNPDTWNQ